MKSVPAIDYPIHELLLKRYSPHSFSKRIVEKTALLSIFEAARWAPSCFNEQPWSYIVIHKTHTDQYAKIRESMAEQNVTWATTAPLLILTVAKVVFSENNKPNPYAWHDIGLATGAMLVQSASMGIYIHQMAAFSKEKIRIACDIPAGWDPVTLIAMGYLAENSELPEKFIELDRSPQIRKKLTEFVYEDTWGHTIDV
jgi:nitroreductase